MQYRTALPALIGSLFYSLGIYTVPLRCVPITTFVSLLAQQVGVSTLNFFSQRLVFVTASLRLRDRPRVMIDSYVQTLNRSPYGLPPYIPSLKVRGLTAIMLTASPDPSAQNDDSQLFVPWEKPLVAHDLSATGEYHHR